MHVIRWMSLFFSMVMNHWIYLFWGVSFSDRLLSVRSSICMWSFQIRSNFSSVKGSILTKLGIKHPWVKQGQVCSNEGSDPFPRGDISEKQKNYWRHLKILLNHLANFNQIWHNVIFSNGNIHCVQKMDQALIQGEILTNFKHPSCLIKALLNFVYC